MVTNDIDIPDMVDLSAKRRKGLSKKSIEVNEKKLEFKAFSKDLAIKFTSGSALDFNVKVPSYIVPYLKRYDGSSFEALISLVLESVSFSYYSKLAEDFSISVFNKGIRFLRFPDEMLINNPVQEDTVSYILLERVLDDYGEYLKFLYLDILDHRNYGSGRVSKFVDNSAFALKKLLDDEKKKNYDLINYYSDEISKANAKYDILQKKYDDLYKYRSSKVQDLEADNLKYQGVILDLQNQIKKYDNLKYYYFLLRIPRFLRIFKFKLGRLKSHTWAWHNKR
jgi:hypothetical protein